MRCPRPDVVNRLRAQITSGKLPRELYISKIAEKFQEQKYIIELAFFDLLKEGFITINHNRNSTYRFFKKGDGHDCDYISMHATVEHKSKKARICKYCDKPIKGRHQKLKHHDKHKCQEDTCDVLLNK